jgi:alpha-1,2-mannosyltransferase
MAPSSGQSADRTGSLAREEVVSRRARAFVRQPARVGVAIWCACFALVIGLVVAGVAPTLSYRVYAGAGQRWLAHEALYEAGTLEGFQYFPQAAMLLSLFARLGSPLGGVAWRALGWGLTASGIWRWARALAPTRAGEFFLAASCLAIGPCIGSLTNGQANLAVAALTLHAGVDLSRRHWWRATLVLAFGVALKPLMLVFLLLAAGVHSCMRGRSGLALSLLVAAPLLFRDPATVSAQYSDCLAKLSCSANAGPLYENLRGLLASLGWVMPDVVSLVAAFATLGISLRLRGRVSEPHASLLLAGLANAYLVLFNPRTQSTSYALTATIAALLAVDHALKRRHGLAIVLSLSVLAWTVNYHWWGLGGIAYWLKPLVGVAFAGVLLRDALAAEAAVTRTSPADEARARLRVFGR